MIIWGTKVKRRRVGYVADYCAVCREPRLFELIRVGIAGHLYFLSLTQGRLAGHEIRCGTCGKCFETEERKYNFVLDGSDGVDIHTAIQRTNPDLGQSDEDKERIAFDKRLREGRLTADERREAISLPMYLLDRDLAQQREDPHWSPAGRVVGKIVAGLTIPMFVLLALVDKEGLAWAKWLYLPVLGIWLAGLFTFPYFIFTRMRSFIRGELEPRLARALAPLDPTLEELDTVYDALRAEKRAIAKKTKSHRVLGLIAELRREEK